MIFVKEYWSTYELNKDIRNNPNWLFEVVGYAIGERRECTLVKWSGLATKEFKHYEKMEGLES